MKLILVAVFFWIGNQDLNPLAQTDVPVQECSSDISKRLDCGWWGISQQDCVSRDCCWEPTASGPSCFRKTSSRCHVAGPTRFECGWWGISRKTCEDRGCCYGDAWGAPSCYYHATSNCNVRMGDRKDCGYSGITAEKCEENMSCCYGAASRGPWCYYGKS
ncbi:integumentary mucin C.1-like [Rhopilema esculentum]|uniref:integumentary mucin C.1-like n=1 Tax=Rhopilema esculentum TaxID=499914 RepID=UPI0031D3ED57